MDDLVKSIINMKVKAVYFSGGGEPTIYPHISKYVEMLYNNGVEVALLTNGTLLEQVGIIDIAYMFNYIAVSVPAVTRENFSYITGSNNLDKVLNCADIIKSMHRDKSPIIGARVVLTSIIYKETEKILSVLKDKNYDYVLFKIVRDYEDRGLGIKEDQMEILKKIIESIGPLDNKFTNLDRIFDYKIQKLNHDKCIINEMGILANVNADGKVYPNIVEIGQENFCIGNLYDASLEKMWHGRIHDRVKEESHKKWSSKECKNCRSIAYNNIIYELLDKMPSVIEKFI
jgi:radical SAM protein with 4Fe4S-binding SPASM domain